MPSKPSVLVLNGSFGEGGSALFRTAITVSCLTQLPVRIHNVRGGTRKPGLTAEDLSFLKACIHCVKAHHSGAELASEDVTFEPQQAPKPMRTRIDVQEHEEGVQPGSAVILAAALTPILSIAGGYSKLLIHGETYNERTLTFDVFESCTSKAWRHQGLYVQASQQMAGFGFGGAGEITVEIEPSECLPIQWKERGELKEVRIRIITADLADSVAKRGIECAEAILKERKWQGCVEFTEAASRSTGAFVAFCAEFDQGFGSGTAMGARGVRMEQVVKNALAQLDVWMNQAETVDPFIADQLLIPAVLANEPSFYSTTIITQRLITMAWVIKQFIPVHVTITGRVGEPGAIQISR